MGEDDARETGFIVEVKVIVVIVVGKTGREARNGRSQAINQSHETHEAGWMRVEVFFFFSFFCIIFGVKEEKANRRRTMEVRETRDGRNNKRK